MAPVLHTYIHTYIHQFNGPSSRTTGVSQYQKGKTNLGFTEASDSEWQWHQLGHMQVCISLQADNHASTSPLSFLQAGCPSCCINNGIKALKQWYQCYDARKHRKWPLECSQVWRDGETTNFFLCLTFQNTKNVLPKWHLDWFICF